MSQGAQREQKAVHPAERVRLTVRFVSWSPVLLLSQQPCQRHRFRIVGVQLPDGGQMSFRRWTRAMDQLVCGQLQVRIDVVRVEEKHSFEVTLFLRAPLASETGFVFDVRQLPSRRLDGGTLTRA